MISSIAIFLKAAWGILKLVPYQVWIVAGFFVGAYIYGANEHHIGFKEAKAEDARDAEVKRKAQEASDAIANAKLFDISYTAKKQAEFADWKLAQQKQDDEEKYQRLKGEKSVFIPPIIMARYADLPRGYILWRDGTATFANGGDVPRAPDASEGSVSGPSGVSIDQISDLDLAQARAFREVRAWGAGWQQYAFRIKQECETAFSTLKGKQ